MEEINCIVCGSKDTDFISDKGKDNIEVSMVCCKNCGLTYLNPRWSKERYHDFYTSSYDDFYRPEIRKNTIGENYSQIAQSVYSRISKILNKEDFQPKSILEIGSGDGFILNYFLGKSSGSRGFAIEPSLESQKIMESNNITIVSNDADSDWELASEKKFDLIIMRHVLEHFLDPITILKKATRSLKDNGVIYIAVPNSYRPKHLFSDWVRVAHTYYFSKISLQNVTGMAGLESVGTIIEGDNFNAYELYTVLRKADSIKKPVINKSNYTKQKLVFDDVLTKRTRFCLN